MKKNKNQLPLFCLPRLVVLMMIPAFRPSPSNGCYSRGRLSLDRDSISYYGAINRTIPSFPQTNHNQQAVDVTTSNKTQDSTPLPFSGGTQPHQMQYPKHHLQYNHRFTGFSPDEICAIEGLLLMVMTIVVSTPGKTSSVTTSKNDDIINKNDGNDKENQQRCVDTVNAMTTDEFKRNSRYRRNNVKYTTSSSKSITSNPLFVEQLVSTTPSRRIMTHDKQVSSASNKMTSWNSITATAALKRMDSTTINSLYLNEQKQNNCFPSTRTVTKSGCKRTIDGRKKARNVSNPSPSSHGISSSAYTIPLGTTISLSHPKDDVSLSPVHCYIRKHCIEAFVVNSKDKNRVSEIDRNILFDVVGTRCTFCRNVPFDNRGQRSIQYASRVDNLYHSVECWYSIHCNNCQHIPNLIRRDLEQLSKSYTVGRRLYWSTSSKALGLIDTNKGIQYFPETINMNATLHIEDNTPQVPLVVENDKSLVSNLLFFLMSHIQKCAFSEDDRISGRSHKKMNVDIGSPGLACRYCNGMTGVGRYFFRDASFLNIERNLERHFEKCTQLPKDVKAKIDLFKEKKQKHARNPKGNRKLFFETVWKRMHTDISHST